LQIVDHRTHDFDDGSLATVYFQIPPVKRHKNETDAIAEQFEQVGKRLKVFGEESKEVGEHNKLVGSSQVKGKIIEISDDNNMDIDQPETQSDTSTNKVQETSPTEINFELLSDDKIEKASKEQLVDLKKRIETELRIREEIEANSSGNSQISSYGVSTQELKDKLSKAESRMEGFSTPNTPNNSNLGGIVAVVGVVSAFAIGSVALVRSKLGKNKKK
jgi:hypothetical protein